MEYDIIIIGGGISGLNILYQLDKLKYNKKILLLEKNNYFGGRMKTFRKTINNTKYHWEEGAARFNNTHKLFINLIHELKLNKYIIDIGSDITFISSTKYNPKYINKNPFDYITIILNKLKNEKEEFAKSFTFKDYAIKNKVVSKEDFDFVLDSFGYYSELVEMNAFDAMHLFKTGITNKLTFHGLSCNFDTLIKELVNHIKNENYKLKLNTNVKNIIYNNSIFKVETDKQIYYSKKVIFAIPKPNLLKFKILKPINNLLNSIVCKPLCRIYSIYDKNNIWFNNIGKITTNNHLRYVIPVNKENGVIMVSYSDNKFAKYWKYKENLIPIIKKLLDKTFNIKTELPLFIKKSYWECGVGYWKQNTDSKIISKQMLHPIKDIPLYICGENYSTTQGWIEGALLSSNQLIKKII